MSEYKFSNLVLEDFLKEIGIPIFAFKKNGDLIFINKELKKLFNDILFNPRNISDIPLSSLKNTNKIKNHLSTERAYSFSDSLATQNGNIRFNSIYASLNSKQFYICFLFPLNEKENSDKTVIDSENRLRNIIKTAVDSIISTDERGKIISINDATQKVFGYSEIELIGENVKILMTNEHKENHDKYLLNYKNTGVKKIIGHGREVNARRKDGHIFPVELSVSEATIDNYKIFTGIIRDISIRKQMEEDLANSINELQQFAYVASHDLQEPLRMVTSFLQLLTKRYSEKLDKDANEFISFAIEGADRMRTLINDLLTYSRVGSQIKSFKNENLEKIVESVKQNLFIAIKESNAEIIYKTLPNLYCDKSQIIQLFQNLINNSIKFRSEESPKIEIHYRDVGNEWLFSIRDNGIGIQESYRERIFIIFQRLHEKEKYPGTGIGLAICKKIVEIHHGKIWVESNHDGGSIFYFTIRKDLDNE